MNAAETTVRSIVLIDDDQDFLHLMRRRLQMLQPEFATSGPVDIHVFTDPVEALVNLPAEGLCVIFVDYNMPGCTGLDSLPKLLKASIGPVILLTSENEAKIAAEAFRAGASDYVAKSEVVSDDQRLVRAIREAVHRYRLEARNTLLTRELKLMNIELEAKNKRLKELTETAHQFVDDVAHDFRTPLTVIEQFAEIVADGLGGPVTPTQKDHLGIIVDAARDLSEMVDDFLDSSRLRAKALPVDRQRHTVQELFDAVKPMLDVRAEQRKITIERTIAENTRPFFADLSKVDRILTNLAVNAIKISPEGGNLRLWAEPTESGDVRIGITDHGIGLKPEDLKIIFDRFQQVGEPQVGTSSGFGLGLSIVKQLVWLNLGTIEVQSEPGKGSTFMFSLPAFDPHRILNCYLRMIQGIENPGDLWMLQIRARNEKLNGPLLRHLIASSSFARDLVLQDEDSPTVNVLGVSSDPEVWTNRMRETAARFDPAAAELEIKSKGPWKRETESVKLVETLLECLGTRRAYVETNPIDR